MGLRFRKSIKLGKGARINISKSGVGASFGVKGARVTKKANGGTRTTLSIPGTGLSYVKESGNHKHDSESNISEKNEKNHSNVPKKHNILLWILGWIFIFPVPLTALMLRKKDMNPIIKYAIIALGWIVYCLIGFYSVNNTQASQEAIIVVERLFRL